MANFLVSRFSFWRSVDPHCLAFVALAVTVSGFIVEKTRTIIPIIIKLILASTGLFSAGCRQKVMKIVGYYVLCLVDINSGGLVLMLK